MELRSLGMSLDKIKIILLNLTNVKVEIIEDTKKKTYPFLELA